MFGEEGTRRRDGQAAFTPISKDGFGVFIWKRPQALL